MNLSILIIVPNYWGKGKTADAAWRKIREAGGLTQSRYRKSGEWVQYAVHPKSYCEDVHGHIVHPKEHPPQRIDAGYGVKD